MRESGIPESRSLGRSLLVLAVSALMVTSCAPRADEELRNREREREATAGLEVPTGTVSYDEPHRPRFHFSPPSGWMNDPNGLVHYDGEWHLFYQYYPDDTVWGPMHWGHAVSRDLVRWEHLPIALSPDSLGYIFSGSAVVDWKNTSGFGREGTPPLVAIFTYHDPIRGAAGADDHESQGIAYSTDRGRTWRKYAGNPVLPNPGGKKDFRDPNVFWHEPTARWVMVVSVTDHVELYASPDLRAWTYLSSFGADWGAHGGTWECPDLFPIRVEGSGETKWVLLLNLNPGGPQGGSGTQYFVGDFDGSTFTLDPAFAATLTDGPAVWLDWGRDDYAGVTWSDVPPEDGRRIFLGWMSNWDYAQVVPTSPWRSAMTLPRELRLVSLEEGYRVFARPVGELTTLRGPAVELPSATIVGAHDLTGRLASPVSASELVIEFETGSGTSRWFGVQLSNEYGERYRFGFDAAAGEFVSDRRGAGDASFAETFADRVHRAPRLARGDTLRMHMIFDLASVEVFLDDGATVVTETFFPTVPFDRIALFSDGGEARSLGGKMIPLTGIW